MSKLAFNGLQENKLVFTFDEVKEVCPYVDETVGAINGFGLLQAVQHYPSEGAGTTTSLNFLHYTMQEFLSALHVSNLPSDQQSSLMKKTFWDGHYNFMWMMFIGIVGIKSDVFVNFVSKGKENKRKSGIRMKENILSDKRRRLHVFQCYMEAKSSAEAPDVISDMFKDGKINIKGVKLLPHHISSLMTYVSDSSMQWNTLQLNYCKITDIGMSALEQFISDNTTFGYVDLRDNMSSPWGVYCAIIRHCSVDSLTLCGDHGIEDYVNKIKDCLQMNTKLISLTLCNITNNGVISISEAIQGNTTLQIFDVSNNSIYDDGATAIGDSLKHNISLRQLNISHNNITDKGIKVVAEAIRMNSTLRNINISKNHISTEGILYFMEAVEKNCILQVVNITHNNVTRSRFTSIKQCINNLQYPIQIIASWNEIVSRSGELLVKSIICTLEESEDITEDVWSFEDYDHDYIVTCLSECFKEDDILIELNLSKNKVMRDREKYIVEAIKINKTLQKLDASYLKIHEGLISDLLKISKSLKELNISNNGITSDGAKEIATAISVNTTLEKLDLSCNMLSDDGVTFISNALKNNISLQELNMSKNKITSEGAKYISEAIQVNTTLEKLDLSSNVISNDGAAVISDSLQFNISLQELNMSRNEITGEGTQKITTAIQVNTTLKQLDLSINKISDEGANFLSDGLKNNISLLKLNISHNNITDRGIKVIAETIKINSTLQNINISKNHISTEGLLYFMEAVEKNCILQVVNITHNNVTRSGFTSIKQCIDNLQYPIQIIASWNEIVSRSGELLVKSTICTLEESEDITEDVWSFDDYDHDYIVTCLSECFKEDDILIELNLSKNKIMRDREKKIFEAIKINKTLQKLDASYVKIHEGLTSDLLKISKSLKELDISNNEITSDGAKEIATAISVNKTLEKLDLSSNEISNDGAAAIIDGLQFNISLQELNMSGNEITGEGTQKITTAIQVNNTLKQLDLSMNKISDEGENFLSDGLKNNISLLKLNISHNNITDRGIKVIAEAIKINSTLQNINISKNHISTEGLLYFMEAIKNNCTLQVVNITHNNVTRSGFTSIKQCIENLQHPIQIITSWNEIREGCKLVTKISTSCTPGNIEEDVWSHYEYDDDLLVMCLSECLKEDDIQELYINPDISDDGAAAISDALKTNNSLQILKMSYNNITSKGAKLIAEAIKVNKTLQVLDIHDNNISDDGAAAISDALKSNNSLQILTMSYNNITSEGAKSIAEAIKVNTTLHTLHLGQSDINDAVSFNMSVLTAVYHNNTLMELTLPDVYDDDDDDDDDDMLVESEVEKINKERTRQGISTLTCLYW